MLQNVLDHMNSVFEQRRTLHTWMINGSFNSTKEMKSYDDGIFQHTPQYD